MHRELFTAARRTVYSFKISGGRVIQERRLAPRYRIDATIGVDGGTGRAIDLSANSVFFETGRQLVPGDAVSLIFPLERTGPGATVKCAATIVRVEPRGETFAVAAVYEPVSFSVAPAAEP
jgi:hypothetical protein